jgi:hypothetical protein
MGMIGDDDAGETGHAPACPQERATSIECTVTVKPAIEHGADQALGNR